jgi:hypothetical protein
MSDRERSNQRTERRAVATLDGAIELRERLAAILDELDDGDPRIASANLALVLRDLDGLTGR